MNAQLKISKKEAVILLELISHGVINVAGMEAYAIDLPSRFDKKVALKRVRQNLKKMVRPKL